LKTTDYHNRKVVDKYFKKTLGSVYIGYPALLRLAGDVRGKQVLDLGCGSGWLAHKLCRKGAKVVAVDNSPSWIDVCRAQKAGSAQPRFLLADGSNLGVFKNGRFDLVTANMVFLNVSSGRKLARMFAEIGRVLKKDGAFIFSVCHPLAEASARTAVKLKGGMRGVSYFTEGYKQKTSYLLADYSSIAFVDSHWSLEFYSRLLRQNGMLIAGLREPRPAKIDPRRRLQDYRVPEYIFFECRKG